MPPQLAERCCRRALPVPQLGVTAAVAAWRCLRACHRAQLTRPPPIAASGCHLYCLVLPPPTAACRKVPFTAVCRLCCPGLLVTRAPATSAPILCLSLPLVTVSACISVCFFGHCSYFFNGTSVSPRPSGRGPSSLAVAGWEQIWVGEE